MGGDLGEHRSPVPTTPPGPAEPFDRLTELACDVAGAPIALVSRLGDDGVRVWHAAPGADAIDREVPVAETLCRLVADAQHPVVVPDADSDSRDGASRDGESAAVLAVGIRAWAGFPIRDTDGTVLGSLTVVDTHPRPWTDEQVRRLAGIARAAGDEMALRADLDISQRSADELAHRLRASDRAARASDRDARRAYDRAERADALANAARRQAGAAVELAETLQQSLTPQHPPRVPGMEIAARHRGPTDGHSYSGEVLGDFYDVFATPTGWGVVVGDVCGHGADAARTTALARSTARALGHSEPDPALVLTAVNGVLHDWFDTARSFVTAVYAQITDHDAPEPAGLTVQIAAAGHPPGSSGIPGVWSPSSTAGGACSASAPTPTSRARRSRCRRARRSCSTPTGSPRPARRAAGSSSGRTGCAGPSRRCRPAPTPTPSRTPSWRPSTCTPTGTATTTRSCSSIRSPGA